VKVVVVVAVVRKIGSSSRVCEISSGINNDVAKHLPDVARCFMARQTERKKGFQMQYKKLEVIDVVVLSSLKTARADISL
jgi:hypothetical protein